MARPRCLHDDRCVPRGSRALISLGLTSAGPPSWPRRPQARCPPGEARPRLPAPWWAALGRPAGGDGTAVASRSQGKRRVMLRQQLIAARRVHCTRVPGDTRNRVVGTGDPHPASTTVGPSWRARYDALALDADASTAADRTSIRNSDCWRTTCDRHGPMVCGAGRTATPGKRHHSHQRPELRPHAAKIPPKLAVASQLLVVDPWGSGSLLGGSPCRARTTLARAYARSAEQSQACNRRWVGTIACRGAARSGQVRPGRGARRPGCGRSRETRLFDLFGPRRP